LLAIGLGSLVIFVLMNLIGWAGEKRGLLVFSAISDGTQS
jgi:cytosine/uracil/thiamine/allantoin permease